MNTSSSCSSNANCPRDVLGPSSCSEGWCLCRNTYCFGNGICRKSGSSTCHLSTQTACPSNGCMSLQGLIGPTTCNRGMCHCNSGFCFDRLSKKCLPAGTFSVPPHLEEGQERWSKAGAFSTVNNSYDASLDGADVGTFYAAMCVNMAIFVVGVFATSQLIDSPR